MRYRTIMVLALLISTLLLSSAFASSILQLNTADAKYYRTPTPQPSPGTIIALGYMNVGSSTDRSPTGDKDSCRYQAPESGTLNSISMYIQTAGALVRFGVYSDLNGQPNQLLGQSNLVPTTANTWITAPISVPVVAGQNYWLTIVSNSTVYWNYDGGALAGNGKQASTTLSASYGPFTYWGTAKFSMYATYAATSNTTPTASPSPSPAASSTPAPTPAATPTPTPIATATPSPTPKLTG